ncbi:hypothetical protein Q0590_34325 [Rhodocytophaga aerolata]|uniref:Uncharacterized protein n=1 Tax=Rhodocytophaga aerolata TaxID=455078 RepID=A0ABT8RJI0_9BACT|nr:hypothetical protein [Rhodocytophaga aerolata]MDO1451403.1 hypothetical protein [Rhodocytophaga aerolata]
MSYKKLGCLQLNLPFIRLLIGALGKNYYLEEQYRVRKPISSAFFPTIFTNSNPILSELGDKNKEEKLA